MFIKVLQIGLITLVMHAPQLMASQLNVIVNKNAGINSLTADEIRQIYLAKRNSFPNGKTVVPIDNNEDSKVFGRFYDKIVHKGGSQLNSYWSRLIFTGKGSPPQQVNDRDDILKMVETDSRAMAYVEGDISSSKVVVVYSLEIP
jgi:hypothetical protein